MEMSVLSYLVVPLAIFLLFVAPLWLTFHYITKWKRMRHGPARGVEAADPAELERLRAQAEKLEQRIHSLETILDQESPDWRNRS